MWRTISSSKPGGSRNRPCAQGRDAVVDEIHRLQKSIAHMPKEAPHELAALLDVHLMLLQDEDLTGGVKHWITRPSVQRRVGADHPA
jgi:phosphoenolpyruvate-protein kinase (PTS system EI component)